MKRNVQKLYEEHGVVDGTPMEKLEVLAQEIGVISMSTESFQDVRPETYLKVLESQYEQEEFETFLAPSLK